MFETVLQTDFDKKCEFLFNLYNRLAKKYNLPRVLKLTPARRRVMGVMRNYTYSDLRLFLREFKKAVPLLSASDWFTFDWVIQESNFVKVMEGKYSKCFRKPDRIDTSATYTLKEF